MASQFRCTSKSVDLLEGGRGSHRVSLVGLGLVDVRPSHQDVTRNRRQDFLAY